MYQSQRISWLRAACIVLVLLLCGTAVLCACSKDPDKDPDETPPTDETNPGGDDVKTVDLILNGQSQYTIVRPDAGGNILRTASVSLRKALMALSNVDEVGLMTDYETAVEKELLIGDTNRPESAEVKARLGDDAYRAEIVNDKIVIVGESEAAVARGVRYFIREVLGYVTTIGITPQWTLSVPADLMFVGAAQSNTASDPRNPEDVIVYSCDVFDHGAMGDGTTDDTKAFQAAIDAVYKQGGGTVYVPAGQYLIKGSLTVKRSVYLAGAWSNPETAPADIARGTVLLATGNRGNADAAPLITIGASAGVIGLTVYYPEQTLDAPVAYPASILIKDNLAGDGTQHSSSVQNVTLVNAWRGIAADQGNQLPSVHDAYMTVLDYGFRINKCYDCARISALHIGPSYWASYAGLDEAEIAAVTKKSAVGVILMRTDGQMMNDVVADSCRVGVSLERNTTDSGETAGYTNLSNVRLTNCTVGINNEYNSASFSMMEISCSGEGAVCVQTTNTTAVTGSLRLYDCKLTNPDGPCVYVGEGAKATVAVQNSTFSTSAKHYAVDARGGMLSLTNNDFSDCAKAVNITKTALSAIVSNNKTSGSIENALGDDQALVQTASVSSLPDVTDFALDIPAPPVVAATKQIFNVKEYGAKGDGKADDTAAFEDAISAAKKAGGGIVYLPAGYYNVTSGLTIPTGVELRGIHEGMHVTTGEGSVIYVTENHGAANEYAFITMEKGSGLRGITFWYPRQAWNNIVAYPWTVSVEGQDCVIRNICFGNTYQAINMAEADCGGHYVDNITGCVLSRGIALDGSTKTGVLMNTHFNITFYSAVWGTKLTDASGAFGSGDMAVALFKHMNANLTAYSFGETVDEQVLFIFNYRARYGMDFTGGFDGKIVGSGVDGSLCGIRVTGSYDNDLVLLNFMDDIVPGETPEGNLGIYVKVDDLSTVRFVASGASSYNYVPSGLVVLESGNLVLDGFDARVTPASGNGAILVKSGSAEVSGIVFQHVGPLNSLGQFSQQSSSASTVDIRVDGDGELSLYSAMARYFFRDDIKGDTLEYNYVVTQ